MNSLPRIILVRDFKKEQERFFYFLHHPYSPQLKIKILSTFPELENLLKNSKNEKSVIEQFLKNFYEEHSEAIEKIISDAKKEFDHPEKQLQALGKIMDFTWPADTTYYAHPTVLPFSPFFGNSFYFSILGKIKGTQTKSFMHTAIHEISHFVFFSYLEKIHIGMSEYEIHFFKEALTAALFNQEPLKTAFSLQEKEYGNPEIKYLRILHNGTIKYYADFIYDMYIKARKNKEDFPTFLQDIMEICHTGKEEFDKKREFWNLHGSKIPSSLLRKEEYEKPIKLGSVPLTPFFFSSKKNKKKIFYLGVRHSFNPKDIQFAFIEKKFNDFLKNTSSPLVIVESFGWKTQETKSEAIKKGGEIDFMAYLCNHSNVPINCFEPDRGMEMNYLLKKYSKEQIAYYYFGRTVAQWYRLTERPHIEEYLKKFLKRDARVSKWDDFVFSIEHMKEIHQKLFHTSFSLNDKNFFQIISNPQHKDNPLQELVLDCSRYRNETITKHIKNAWNTNDLFVVYGRGHALYHKKEIEKINLPQSNFFSFLC